MKYISKFPKHLFLFVFILLLVIILIIYLLKHKQYITENFCDKVGKECIRHSDGRNSCCDGLYCVREKCNFHNRVCSKTPEEPREEDNEFISDMIKFGKNMYNDRFIEICGEEDIEIKTNICNDGLFKIHLPCPKKPNFDPKFPETNIFSFAGDEKCRNKN
jgi:hypothetical protein